MKKLIIIAAVLLSVTSPLLKAVSVRRGSYVYVYNANGSQISAIPAGN